MSTRGLALVLTLVGTPLSAAEPFARLGHTKLRHADRPLCVEFSPDGTKLYSGGKDGILRVWSVATGELLTSAAINTSHLLRLDFVQNGNRLAALYSDGGIHFLHPQSLEQKSEVKMNRPSLASLSADGAFAAVQEEISTLTVYDTRTGLPRLELPDGPFAAMSPDGAVVAAADTTGSVALYRTLSGKPILTAFHGGTVTDIRFRTDGNRFATTDSNHAVKVWDPNRDKPVAELANTGSPILFVGQDLLAASHKGGVGFYDLSAKKWVKHIPEASGAFAVSADGKWLAAVGTTGHRVRLWNLATGEQLHAKDYSFANLSLLAPSEDGRSLFGVAGTHAFTWKVGDPRSRTLGTLPDAATQAAFGGRLILAQENALAIWDEPSFGKPLPKEPSRTLPVSGGMTSVAISKDGKWAAYSDGEKRIELFDPARGKVLRTLPISVSACELAFTQDGSRLAVLGRDGWLRVWKIGENEGEVWKHRFARNLTGALAISADGRLLAAATANQLTVLDAVSGEVRFSLEKSETEAYYRTAAFTSDGRQLFVGTAGLKGSVQVWDTTTQTLVRRIATGGVSRLAITPDGKWIFSTGDDETISVWR
jgi:WD40 repeat protein